MPPAIGIDLGTTFSCAAVYRTGKGPEIIPYEDGERIFPSIVYFDPNTGAVLVGKNAVDEIPECPANGLFDAKRIIGRKFNDEYISKFINSNEIPFKIVCGENDQAAYEITVSNKTVKKTPEEISAEVLKYIKKAASVHLGEEITEAVISVPAYFSNAQRKSTKRAANLAGLEVLKLITEPTAAAIHYVSDKERDNAKILVFDFGGGTLDVSIININDKQFEVNAVDGDTFLGGRNIDEILFNQFQQKILNDKQFNKKISESRKRIFFRRLRAACVELKKKLSTRSNARHFIPSFIGGDEEFCLSMSRNEFEDITKETFERALEIVKRCLRDSGISDSDISEVVLVGGTTRIPKVREMLISYFNKPLKTDIHPDESVAAGASVQAALIKDKLGDLERYKITEITPLTLGIEANIGYMDIFIPKNSTLPCETKKKKRTSENNQSAVRIAIFEGERRNVKYNNLLGEFVVNGFPPKRAGDVEYYICFELDEDGILNVKAYEEEIGINTNLVVTMGQFRLSERQIKISEEQAKKHKYEDETFQKFTLLKSKIEMNCQQVLYDAEKLPKEDDQNFIQTCCEELQEAIKELEFTDIETLEAKYAIFNSAISDLLKENCLLQIEL